MTDQPTGPMVPSSHDTAWLFERGEANMPPGEGAAFANGYRRGQDEAAPELERLRNDVTHAIEQATAFQTESEVLRAALKLIIAARYDDWEFRDGKVVHRPHLIAMDALADHEQLPSSKADMRAFGASDAACYKWPDDTPEHKALRAAYIEGAADCGGQE